MSSPKPEPEVKPLPKVKKFNNGWTSELEVLVGDWADRAQCYRWMHDKTSRAYSSYNQYFMIPVIVLSTLTGTANFGLDSLFTDPNAKKLASLGIGGVSIFTGIISTVANFLRYGQGSESHLISSISWAKFSRLITIELALHPNERMEAFAFLKMFRIELDRLIEQSPTIPENVISNFKREFRMLADVKRPEVTGAIEHTRAFDNRNERLKAVAAEAALVILHKKRLIKDLVLEDLDKRVKEIMAEQEASKRAGWGNPLYPPKRHGFSLTGSAVTGLTVTGDTVNGFSAPARAGADASTGGVSNNSITESDNKEITIEVFDHDKQYDKK